ncbi:MAG: 2-iminoacetate synthase ThiH, partial [Aeromonas veronii]
MSDFEPFAQPQVRLSDSPPLGSSQNKGEGLRVRAKEPTFLDRWHELEWDDIGMQIRAKTAVDVARALSAPRRTLADFMALISPAAEAYLPQMA